MKIYSLDKLKIWITSLWWLQVIGSFLLFLSRVWWIESSCECTICTIFHITFKKGTYVALNLGVNWSLKMSCNFMTDNITLTVMASRLVRSTCDY
jgi:hypothetical protein